MSTASRPRPRRSRTLRRGRLATLLLAGLVVTACGDSDTADDRSPAAAEGSASTSDGATSSPSTSPSPTSPAPATTPPAEGGASVALPIYLVGDTPQGPRLFREFLSVPAADPLLEAALLVIEGGSIQDPDYRTLFPPTAGPVSSVRASDGMFVVELADEALVERPRGMSETRARLAVQQLVHTLQAVHQARVPMTVLLDGEPTSLLGIDTTQGVTNADPLEVLALVNVTSPEHGATVSGSFRASGVASAFEATVPWEVRQDGEVVLSGFSTAEGWMDRLYPWRSEEIDVSGLQPGAYTFVAGTGDPADGEGPGPTEDSKEITVR